MKGGGNRDPTSRETFGIPHLRTKQMPQDHQRGYRMSDEGDFNSNRGNGSQEWRPKGEKKPSVTTTGAGAWGRTGVPH